MMSNQTWSVALLKPVGFIISPRARCDRHRELSIPSTLRRFHRQLQTLVSGGHGFGRIGFLPLARAEN